MVSLQELGLAGWVFGHADLPSRQVSVLSLAWGRPLLCMGQKSVLLGLAGVTERGLAPGWWMLLVILTPEANTRTLAGSVLHLS